MRTKYVIGCIVLLILINVTYQVSYLVSMPKYMQPGTLFKINVNLLTTKSTTLSVELALNGVKITSLQKTVRGCHTTEISFKVPNTLKHGRYVVKVSGKGGTDFTRTSYVTCIGNSPFILVQLDRGMYAENEKVQNRIIVLYPSLRPYSGDINIKVLDSKSRLIYQHLNRTLSRGVLDNTFSVPSSPNLGTWKVQVESEKEVYEKYFVVRKYIVPNFYVSINCDKTSLDTTTRTLKCTVTTRDQWDDNFISSFLYFLRLTNEKTLKGTYRFQAVTKKGKKDVFLKNTYGDINGNKQFTISWNSASDVTDDITVIAQVGDNTTGTTVSSKRTILLKKDTTTSTWELEPRLLSFQPGLPLKLFIKFAWPKSASLNFDITYRHRSIRTCTLASPSYRYKTEWVSTGKEKATPDSNGYGALNLQPASNVYEIILSTYQGTSKKKLTLTAALSSKGQYISIQPNQAYAKVGRNLQLDLQSTFLMKKVIFYQVVSRGQMISNGEINGQNRKTQQLSIRVTGKWYPRATVIITYASMETGVVVDSKSFEVIGNPVINTVILRSSKSSAAPKDKVRFHIGASNNSTVYLMSVDKGIHTSQQGFDIDINDIYGGVAQCTQDQKSQTDKFVVKVQGPRQAFEDLGFFFIGDGSLQASNTVTTSLPTICKNPCSPNQCRNGGRCATTSNGNFLCKCSNSYYGHLCQNKIQPRIHTVYRGMHASSIPLRTTSRWRPFSAGWARVKVASVNRFVPSKATSNQTPVQIPGIDLGFHAGLLSDFDASQKRLDFPKTWIWDAVYIRKSNTAVYDARIPDSVTSWVTTGFSIHDSEGIGIIPTANEIRVVKDFYIDIIPPASASVGSTMAVRVTVYNYLHKELTVMFMLIFGGKRSTVSRDVPSGGSNAVYMDAKVTKGMKGYNKVTVVAYDMGRFQMLDYVQKDVFVKLPGIEREYSLPKMVILDSNGQYSKSFPLSYPKSMIDGSVRVYFTVTGDVMAQSIQGLESLIRLPCGCGEQTMMYLAPNIYVLNYLHATKQLKDDFERKALSYINKGIDRQLNWRRNDGSFSVWGNRDNQGSTWLTAFVLTCFHQAQKYIYIEESIFEGALEWLLKTQNSDGSFSEGRRVIHYDMKGGVHASRVTLAAYVLLTLIENDDIPRLELSTKQAMNKAIQYILSKRTSLYRNKHGLALTAFALQKSGRSTEARELYLKLENMAQKHDGYLYWTYGLQKKWPKSSNLFKDNPNPRASPIDIETTSYALLYLSEKGNVGKGSMILKWLVSQRNPTGGFSSTQDTVVSLYALSEFVVMEQNGNKVKSNLNVTIIPKDKTGSAIGNLAFTVNTTNRLLLQQSQEFESKIQEVEIRGKGFGFAIVDIVVQYNAEAVSSGDFYQLSAKVPKGKETFDSITVNVCVSRTGVQSNGMSVVEVGVPSGFKGDISKTANNNPRYLKHIEPGFDKVVLYFDKIAGKTCFDVTAGRVDKVTQSESMPIVAYDYYEPGIQGMTNYTSGVLEQMSICDVCKECGVCQRRVLG